MNTRAILFGTILAALSVAVLFLFLFYDRGSMEPAKVPESLEARVRALEELPRSLASLEAKLDRLSSRLAQPRGPHGEEEKGAAPEGQNEKTAALEARMEALVRQLALEEDPVLRGMSYLSSKSARVRKEGLHILKALAKNDPEQIAEIRSMLEDSDPSVRKEAADALAQAGDKDSIPQLANLMSDAAPEVRKEAIDSMVDLMSEKGFSEEEVAAVSDSLMERLKDENADVRKQAAEALGKLNVRSALEALTNAVEDPVEDVQDDALESLVMLKDPAAIPGLRELYSRGSGNNMALAAALKQLGDEQPFHQERVRLAQEATSGKTANARVAAVKALGEHAGGYSRDTLEAALQDASPLVRDAARKALAKLK